MLQERQNLCCAALKACRGVGQWRQADVAALGHGVRAAIERMAALGLAVEGED